jgi:hypothetical protein
MATIVNLRRIERLEEKAGGASWLARLSDAELEARCLTFATGEYPVFKDFPEDKPPVQDSESDNGLLLNELEDKLTKTCTTPRSAARITLVSSMRWWTNCKRLARQKPLPCLSRL